MKKLLIILMLFYSSFVHAIDGMEVLSPEQAYSITGQYIDDTTIKVTWNVLEGYYLYRNKFRFSSETRGIELEEPEFPKPSIKDDPFFGEIEIYRGKIEVILPIIREEIDIDTVTLKVRSQGCADIGICFPPRTQTLLVGLTNLADAPPPVDPGAVQEMEEAIKGAGTASDEDTGEELEVADDLVQGGERNVIVEDPDPFAELTALGSSLGLEDDGILPPEKAFQMYADVKDGNSVRLHWDIADATYLYQHKVKVEVRGDGVSAGKFELPKAKIKTDSVKPDGTIGDVAVYYNKLDIELPLVRTNSEATTIQLKASYQGCADRGICYPPSKSEFTLDLPAISEAETASAEEVEETKSLAEGFVNSGQDPGQAGSQPLSEQDEIAQFLASSNAWIVVGSFFVIGLLLSFTPCVFPMIPILSGIIAGQGTNIGSKRAFILSLVYVLAMAATYTFVGILAGMFGANIQAIFQNPWILASFAGIFVLLALSMFGFFELQLPASLQSKLSDVSNKQKSGSLVGVAVMGLLSALIVGPCIAPPLAGALIYIGQTGDAVLGGTALFAMSMGMGAPLVAIGTSAGKLLPKAGGWMHAVKAAFGVMMLGVAIYLLERVLPSSVSMLLWGTLLIVSSIYIGALNQLSIEANGWDRLRKGLGIGLLVYGILFYVGVAANGKDTLQPLRGILPVGGGAAAEAHTAFKRIKSVEDLDRELMAAKAAGKPVMLDFYADWCVYCIQMEKNTFPDPKVAAELDKFVLLQADVTDQDEIDVALQKRMGITAPPAIIFWDKNGEQPRHLRLMGFLDASDFLAHLGKISK